MASACAGMLRLTASFSYPDHSPRLLIEIKNVPPVAKSHGWKKTLKDLCSVIREPNRDVAVVRGRVIGRPGHAIP